MAAPMVSVKFACKLCGKPGRFLPELILKRTKTTSKHKKWESVIGLEIHAQILSDSKLFSGAGTQFSAPVNTQVSLFDCAIPGTLPVLNKRCVEAGVLTALALKSRINNISKFDRKHYFYADLPTGYQITQQRQPLAVGGELEFVVFDPNGGNLYNKTVRLIQLQLEQDSGKSLHDDIDKKSLIDLNRAGMALMEIVTEPDFTTGEEAAGFVKELHKILKLINTCDGKMAEGSLRVDANISVNKNGEELGKRTEVKNLNSIRNVVKAIEYEIKRQIKVLEEGNNIIEETRSFDAESGCTVPMRDKEQVLDYRFMPEPNLPPLHVYHRQDLPEHIPEDRAVLIDELERCLPILPYQKRKYLQEQFKFNLELTSLLVNDEDFYKLFEEMVKIDGLNPNNVAYFMRSTLRSALKAKDISFQESKLTKDVIIELFKFWDSEAILQNTAVEVLGIILDDPTLKPTHVIKEKNLYQISDEQQLISLCKVVMEKNPKLVRQSKGGKTAATQSLLNRVGKESRGLVNRNKVKIILDKLLDSSQDEVQSKSL